jgi:hypothetical protein
VLERRPRAGGKLLVDHPRGRHDDHANALALAAAMAMKDRGSLRPVITMRGQIIVHELPEQLPTLTHF